MKLAKILTKTIGLGTLFLVARDAHLQGISGKNRNPQYQIAKDYPDMYINSQRIESDTLMTATSTFKKKYFDFCMGDSFMPAVHGVTGYLKGMKNAIVNDVIPLSLSLGAVALKRGGGACAAVLAFLGTKALLYDICGFGKYKKL